MPQAEIDAANPVASSNQELGAGGIPTGGTFEVLKSSQAGQAGAGGGFSAFQAQSAGPEKASGDSRSGDPGKKRLVHRKPAHRVRVI